MFTGIISDMGVCKAVAEVNGWTRLTVEAPHTAVNAHPGLSVSVSGVCLTVAALDGTQFSFDLMPETLRLTTFGTMQSGDMVNLELPLSVGDELGGHLVYGHVDGVGEIIDMHKDEEATVMRVRLPRGLVKYTAHKGSIAFDGVSLTITAVHDDSVTVNLIPYTMEHTTLGVKQNGDKVHVEVDMILKYLGTLYERYQK